MEDSPVPGTPAPLDGAIGSAPQVGAERDHNEAASSSSDGWALQTAGRSVASHARLWIVSALGLTLDLWTKDWAVLNLGMREPRVLIPDALNLRLSLNPGALFGLGAGLAPVFVGASVLALIFVFYLFWQSTARQWSLHVALGCVLGGAIGNLYDRTVVSAYVVEMADGRRDVGELIQTSPDGSRIRIADFKTGQNARPYDLRNANIYAAGPQPVVRDFISVELKAFGYRLWPWIFNIADALLVIGVSILLMNFWFDRRHMAATPTDQ
ncbi:MAG: signal peptidase II [Phycisphaerae bacterium]